MLQYGCNSMAFDSEPFNEPHNPATMADEMTLIAAAYIVLAEKRKKRTRMWIRPYLSRRDTLDSVDKELMLDKCLFKNFTRMSKSDFEFLVNRIEPNIQRQDTNMRNAIPVTTRLTITLRYLATGDSFKSLMYLFRVSAYSISTIVPEVCEALIEGLKEYIKASKYLSIY
ncbi:unnamed protein product [Parnassius apollo]|uniref:(apollo) hypothetical protein n=1 Tax=Parnassius apollo TaxID=110799 RepID=A0A8S3XHT0_PARAO|nr:unnamed protein product [Parnassius apollo]